MQSKNSEVKYGTYDWYFDNHRFARDVRKARLKTKMTQRECDELLGYVSAISNVESNRDHYHPYFQTFLDVCNLFELDPRNYFGIVIPF